MGSPVRLLLLGSRRNTHLGVPVRTYTSSTCTVKHVGSWTRNIPTARTLRSDLRSEGIQRKATMLLSSPQLQKEKRPAGPGNGAAFFKLLRTHPFDQLRVGERHSLPGPATLWVRRGSPAPAWSTRTREVPRTGARSKHPGFILPATKTSLRRHSRQKAVTSEQQP